MAADTTSAAATSTPNRAWPHALLLLLLFSAAALAPAAAQTPTPIPHLDFQKIVGSWYEIARLPNKLEKHCASDAVQLYTPSFKPSRFAVVDSCREKDGSIDTRNAKGKAQDKSGDGKLRIAHTWPFYRKFWVLALAPDAQWLLIGSPNHKYLWILAHTPTLPAATLADVKARAAAQGFDISKLVPTPQNPKTSD